MEVAASATLAIADVARSVCNPSDDRPETLVLKPERTSPDKEYKKSVGDLRLFMKFLAEYPLIRNVVEIVFMISLAGFLLAILSTSRSLLGARISSPERRARWKRPEEIGLGCWKVPK